MAPPGEYKKIRVETTVGYVPFIGRYRRDLETPNWHYYETPRGTLLHFQKTKMIAVFEAVFESESEDVELKRQCSIL